MVYVNRFLKKAIAVLLIVAMLFAVAAVPAHAKQKHAKNKAKVVKEVKAKSTGRVVKRAKNTGMVVKAKAFDCPCCGTGLSHDCVYWYKDGQTGAEQHMTMEQIIEFETMEMR